MGISIPESEFYAYVYGFGRFGTELFKGSVENKPKKKLKLINMIITKHALFRMQQREIDENIVASAILNPDEAIHTFGKRILARKTVGDKTLEVVYIKEDDIIVITVYWLEET